jgi:transcriptional regulator with XRE-family HTH domain
MSKQAIGERLATLRRKAGLTQDEVSEWTGISQGHISYLEKTGELTSLEQIRNLGIAFGMEPAELIAYLWDKPTGGNDAIKKRRK